MNNNQQDQLFTELTPSEGAAISGGGFYYLGNKSGIGVNYSVNGRKQYLAAGKQARYWFYRPPVVAYDKKIGPGYKVEYKKLTAGQNNFDRNGSYLTLGLGATPNIVPNAV